MIEVLDEHFDENLTTLFGHDNDTLDLIIKSEGDIININKKEFKIFLGKMAPLVLIQNQTDNLTHVMNTIKEKIEDIPSGFISMWHNLKFFIYAIAFIILMVSIFTILKYYYSNFYVKRNQPENSALLNSPV